ncbi:hypothetical protein BJX99DRAFT_28973 [Aspergillus californicus]
MSLNDSLERLCQQMLATIAENQPATDNTQVTKHSIDPDYRVAEDSAQSIVNYFDRINEMTWAKVNHDGEMVDINAESDTVESETESAANTFPHTFRLAREVLKWRKGYSPSFPVTAEELYHVPQQLKNTVQELPTGRGRMHFLVDHCLAKEWNLFESNPLDPTTPRLYLRPASPVKVAVSYRGKPKMLESTADYSSWYQNPTMGVGVVICGADTAAERSRVRAQCILYMALRLYTYRKIVGNKPAIMYGVVVDEEEFEFLSLDHTGLLNGGQCSQSWSSRAESIYSRFRLVVRYSASPPRVLPPKFD